MTDPNLIHDFIPCRIEGCDQDGEHCDLRWCGAPRNHPMHSCYVASKPAHIDTTAPEVEMKDETCKHNKSWLSPCPQCEAIDTLQEHIQKAADEVATWPDWKKGYKPSPIDTTGQEKCLDCERSIEQYKGVWVHSTGNVHNHNARPASIATTQEIEGADCEGCADPNCPCNAEDEMELNKKAVLAVYRDAEAVFSAHNGNYYVTSKRGLNGTGGRLSEYCRNLDLAWKSAASKLAPKPAPQAEAQYRFVEWWFRQEGEDDKTDHLPSRYRSAQLAWNAQQAKIEALEQQLDRAEGRIGLLRVEKEELEEKLRETK